MYSHNMYVLIYIILFFATLCYSSSDESLYNYEALRIKYSDGARELFPSLERLEENLSGKASKELERLIRYISKNQAITTYKAEKLIYDFIIKKKTIETRNGILNISNSNEEDELARLIDEFSKKIALKSPKAKYLKGRFHESKYYKHFCLRYVLQQFFNEFDIKTHFLKGNELRNLEEIKKKNFLNKTFTPQIDTRYIMSILDQTFSKEDSSYKSSSEAIEEIDLISISSEERINPTIVNIEKRTVITKNVINNKDHPKELTSSHIPCNYMQDVFFIPTYDCLPSQQFLLPFNNHKGQQ